MRYRAVLLLCLLTALGCGISDLDTYHGRRAGMIGGSSINGTAVLSKMFSQAGHKVSSWSRLSPRLQRADTIVWAPNEFSPPSDEVRQWLDNWLDEKQGRTVIFIERDFDSEPSYWAKILPLAPAGQKQEVRTRLGQARSQANIDRAGADKKGECDWYSVDRTLPVRKAAALEGPLSRGIDAKQAELVVNSRIDPGESADRLLTSQGDVLVSREYYNENDTSQLILVANGSFLLNLPLINHEHRKLAVKLIDEVKNTGSVVFLESGPGEVPILESDPDPEAPTGLELFAKWPLNWVLFQMGLWGLIFACARWPIFGRPKRTETATLSDFGRHITALGELFQRSGDRGYAVAKIRHYQTAVLGETLPQRDSPLDFTGAKPPVAPDETGGDDTP